MEIAFDLRAFAVASLCYGKPLPPAMNAMSILAMAMVICLFGGYLDLPNEQAIRHGVRTMWRRFIHLRSAERR
jgi:hypothetical protein